MKTLLAVFDGHGGDYTANFLERHVAETFISFIKDKDSTESGVIGSALIESALIGSALSSMCMKLNEMLKNDSRFVNGIDTSGACGVVTIVTEKVVVVANVGDCRCMLRNRDGLLEELTEDHTCKREDEEKRIMDAGGFVKNNRIYLDESCSGENQEPSRAWGDFQLSKAGIICSPELRVFERDQGGGELLLLGCDGVFEVMSVEKVVGIVVKEAPSILKTVAEAVEEKVNATTPKSRVSVIEHKQEEIVCRELKSACESVMLEGLEGTKGEDGKTRRCADNQTMCMALLR